MNIEYFIAKRIHFHPHKKNESRPAVRIAILGISIGLAVMIVSLCVVSGFKKEIRNKTIGFGGHIQITSFENNTTYELSPISSKEKFISQVRSINGVKGVHPFVTKPAIIQTPDEFEGIVVKGVGATYDWHFFDSNLKEGSVPDFKGRIPSNKVLISKYLADKLKLKRGDSFFAYFIQNQIRTRKFQINGIYSTNFSEFDKLFVIADMRQLQNLNNWSSDSISGYEVLVNKFDQIDQIGDEVYSLTANKFTNEGQTYLTRTIKQIYPAVFGWLDLLDMNVWVILVLMFAVAAFNMISGLLILILERTNMIGILKSIGATDWSVRKVFLYHSFFLISKGMFWGNIIGLLICIVQYFTHIIPLNSEAYYVAYVPISFNWLYLILLNVGSLILSFLMMIGPSYLITKISPSRIIRYE